MGCMLTVSTDEINVWMSMVMARKLGPERQSEKVSGTHDSGVWVRVPPGNIRVRDHYRNKHASTRVFKSSTYTCDRWYSYDFGHQNAEDPLISTIESINSHGEEYCNTTGKLGRELQ